MEATPERQASGQQVCEELDLTRQTLSGYVKRGCPCTKGRPGKPNLYDVGEVAAWMRQVGLTGQRSSHHSTDDLDAAKLRKEHAMAHNWELRNAELERRLIDFDEHLAIVRRLASTAANRLAGLPAAIAPSLVGLTAGEIQTELETQINAARAELADASRYDDADS